jgi:predicted transcriptional regulator
MNIHIGEVIERKFQESGIKMQTFAERINTVERNVYDIFKRKDIKTDLLRSISEALDYNFFDLYTTNIKSSDKDKNDEPVMTITLNLEVNKNRLADLPKYLNELNILSERYMIKVI